jgi:hypothetical protein
MDELSSWFLGATVNPVAVINPFYAAELPETFRLIQARWLGNHALRLTDRF